MDLVLVERACHGSEVVFSRCPVKTVPSSVCVGTTATTPSSNTSFGSRGNRCVLEWTNYPNQSPSGCVMRSMDCFVVEIDEAICEDRIPVLCE